MNIDSTLAYLLKPSSASRTNGRGTADAGAESTAPGAVTAEQTPEDTVEFSAAARDVIAKASEAVTQGTEQLTADEQEQVRQLASRDAEVRTHEQAHIAAAGGHAKGGPSYEFKTGPDGRQYAVAGEVPIDVSPVPGDPAATIAKARSVQAAAHAPANPSGADRAVAAAASQLQAEAQQELQQEQIEASTEAASTDAEAAPESETTSGTTPGNSVDSSVDDVEGEPLGKQNIPNPAREQTPQAQNIRAKVIAAYTPAATGNRLDVVA